jgi:hypothetical protein
VKERRRQSEERIGNEEGMKVEGRGENVSQTIKTLMKQRYVRVIKEIKPFLAKSNVLSNSQWNTHIQPRPMGHCFCLEMSKLS